MYRQRGIMSYPIRYGIKWKGENMKSYNTGFAVMVKGKDFIRDEGRVCIFSLIQAKRKMQELKAMGYEVQAIPFCRG